MSLSTALPVRRTTRKKWRIWGERKTRNDY